MSQAGFAPNVVLDDAQFEQVSAHMVNLLKQTEEEVEEKERNLRQLYSFDRFN